MTSGPWVLSMWPIARFHTDRASSLAGNVLHRPGVIPYSIVGTSDVAE